MAYTLQSGATTRLRRHVRLAVTRVVTPSGRCRTQAARGAWKNPRTVMPTVAAGGRSSGFGPALVWRRQVEEPRGKLGELAVSTRHDGGTAPGRATASRRADPRRAGRRSVPGRKAGPGQSARTSLHDQQADAPLPESRMTIVARGWCEGIAGETTTAPERRRPRPALPPRGRAARRRTRWRSDRARQGARRRQSPEPRHATSGVPRRTPESIGAAWPEADTSRAILPAGGPRRKWYVAADARRADRSLALRTPESDD